MNEHYKRMGARIVRMSAMNATVNPLANDALPNYPLTAEVVTWVKQ